MDVVGSLLNQDRKKELPGDDHLTFLAQVLTIAAAKKDQWLKWSLSVVTATGTETGKENRHTHRNAQRMLLLLLQVKMYMLKPRGKNQLLVDQR